MRCVGEPFATRVAETVRALMRRADLTQDVLGERVGLSQSALSRRLTGDVAFNTAELAAIARALGVEVTDLLAREVPADV